MVQMEYYLLLKDCFHVLDMCLSFCAFFHKLLHLQVKSLDKLNPEDEGTVCLLTSLPDMGL